MRAQTKADRDRARIPQMVGVRGGGGNRANERGELRALWDAILATWGQRVEDLEKPGRTCRRQTAAMMDGTSIRGCEWVHRWICRRSRVRRRRPSCGRWCRLASSVCANRRVPFSALAKDEVAVREIEAMLPTLPTAHQMQRADARELDFVPEESVQLVLTSPPHWTLKQYNESEGQLGSMADDERLLAELDRVWSRCFRVLVSGG